MVVMITFWAVLYGIAGLTALHSDFVLPSRAFSSLSLLAFGFFGNRRGTFAVAPGPRPLCPLPHPAGRASAASGQSSTDG